MNYYKLINDTTKLEDGTYDVCVPQKREYSSGYQVAIMHGQTSHMDEEHFNKYVNNVRTMLKLSYDVAYEYDLGVWEGGKELSIRVPNLDDAVMIAMFFKQEAIWDWANEIPLAINYFQYNMITRVVELIEERNSVLLDFVKENKDKYKKEAEAYLNGTD